MKARGHRRFAAFAKGTAQSTTTPSKGKVRRLIVLARSGRLHGRTVDVQMNRVAVRGRGRTGKDTNHGRARSRLAWSRADRVLYENLYFPTFEYFPDFFIYSFEEPRPWCRESVIFLVVWRIAAAKNTVQ